VPPLPAANKVVKVEITGLRNGIDWANIFHFAYAGTAPTFAQMATFADAEVHEYGSQFFTLMDTETSVEGCVCTDLTSDTSAQGTATFHDAGTRSGGSIGAQVALLVNDHIQRRYRGGKPRHYMPFGVTTDLTNDNTWTGTFQTTCETQYSAFIANTLTNVWSGGGPLTYVNLSYYANKALRAVPVTDAILSNSINPMVATIRRRDGRKRR